jgi:S-adenosylmethionine:tRNA ribosyltransferase-isomerase
MRTSDFFFNLPDELIAQVPLNDRKASRLMLQNKKSGII